MNAVLGCLLIFYGIVCQSLVSFKLSQTVEASLFEIKLYLPDVATLLAPS
jgi:hypothetical protein